MDEYLRIVIEQYCYGKKSMKARFLASIVEWSYDLSYQLSDEDYMYLEELIEKERNKELKEAMKDLLEFVSLY